MTWEARGADRLTGADRVVTVEANDEAQAERRANRQGILVESVRPISPDDSAVRMSAIPTISHTQAASVDRRPVIPYAEKAPTKSRGVLLATGIGSVLALCAGGAFLFLYSNHGAAVAPGSGPKPASVGVALGPVGLFTRTYSVSGAAWVVKKSGDSVIMRGLQIELVDCQISKADAAKSVQAKIDGDDKEAESDEAEARDWNGRAVNDEYAADFDRSTASDYTRSANDIRTKIATMRSAIAALPSTVDLNQIYSIGDTTALAEAVGFAKQVALVTTDVEGKYKINNVPAGSYYLFGWSVNDNYSIQWLVPVAVNSDVLIDLSNDNAVDVHNFHTD